MDYIVSIGSVCIDEYFDCQSWPIEGDKTIVRPMEIKIGGMIANVASIIGKYGINSYLVDNVSPQNRDMIFSDLESYNVDTSLINIDKDYVTPRAFIMHTGEDRTIFVVVNERKIKLNHNQLKYIRNAKYIYSTISNIKEIENNKDIMKSISDSTKIVFDTESKTFDSFDKDRFYFDIADILIFNEFAFKKIKKEQRKEDIIKKVLSTKKDKIVIITKGKDGCELFTENNHFIEKGIKANIVDTTGAGDMFNATFLYCRFTGKDLKTSLKTANIEAAKSVERFGPK